MITRYVRVTMPDGSRWDVEVYRVASHRAECLAENVDDLDDLIAEGLENDYLLEDYARNNMEWADVKSSAKMTSPAEPPDYEDGWTNGDMEFVEVEV